MRLFWIMAGVFFALGILFVGGAIVIFGQPGEIEKLVARVVVKVTPDPAAKPVRLPPAEKRTAKSTKRKSTKDAPVAEHPGYVHGQRASDPSEIVVINPPKGFATRAGQLGFVTAEKIDLKTLKVSVQRLQKTGRMHAHEAMATLRKEFRTASADVNTLYEVAQSSRRMSRQTGSGQSNVGPPSRVRELACWPQTGRGYGKGIRIGMIDTPVERRHSAFLNRRLVRKSFHDPDTRPGSSVHGTAFAAMFIGNPSSEGFGGLLPEAKLYAAIIFQRDEIGEARADSMALVRAVDWLASKRPHVVNISLAGIDNKAVRKAIARARKQKLIFVAGAGSWGRRAAAAYPAALRSVIAITAIQHGLSPFRNANRGRYIDFAAPGVDVWTAIPGGGDYQTGSSFAATYGAAAVAVAVASGVRRSPGDICAHLRKFAVDAGDPDRDNT
tara:strand:+ start:1400 stop:2722 length:1323 start_codon:yes stop_codon:yes gene_type:complete